MESIQCERHGNTEAAFVCRHVVEGLLRRERVGFFWSQEDPDNPHPDAWCSDCDERLKKTGGEWIGEALERLQATMLCAHCYEAAKMFHMGGDPWS